MLWLTVPGMSAAHQHQPLCSSECAVDHLSSTAVDTGLHTLCSNSMAISLQMTGIEQSTGANSFHGTTRPAAGADSCLFTAGSIEDVSSWAVFRSARTSCALLCRPTMMFQTRSFTFTLSNPSLTALNYQWQIMDRAGNLDTSGGFKYSVRRAHTQSAQQHSSKQTAISHT